MMGGRMWETVKFQASLTYSLLLVLSVSLTLVIPTVGLSKGHSAHLDWGATVSLKGESQPVADFFAAHLSTDDIKKYLETLTASPHIAGSDNNKELALMIYQEWQQYRFDSVGLFNYSVLLSYPNTTHPNTLTLRKANGERIYDSHVAQEPPLTPDEKSPGVAPPFTAYSGYGNVTGPLVYVNYGQLDDFLYLTSSPDNHLYNLTGYICIVRYGRIYRGDKARLAQQFGCRGLLIYSDPQDYAPLGEPVYPHGAYLPEYGVQRGSLSMMEGDVLTPGIPAISGMYRRPYQEAVDEKSVPSIPVQPISYGDAVHFMGQLSTGTVPRNWVGGLQVTYRLIQSADNDNYTELVVNNYQEQRWIYNVVAKLYGGVEPDRHVVMGNHRDAWVFGAADPNSGTAGLMNLAKVIGQLRQNADWRPGRTLVLCSWDAEEYGLLGSTEWIEDFGKLLGAHTLAYLNVDVAVAGVKQFIVSANPLVYEVMWKAAAMVKSPNNASETIYDEWLRSSKKVYNGIFRPEITNLGSGSDYTMFLQSQGISCGDVSYMNDANGSYPVYHSVHDNFYWMSHYGDPSFTHHRSLTAVWVMAALQLTTIPLPPVDITHYSYMLEGASETIHEKYLTQLKEHGIAFELLLESVYDFSTACGELQKMISPLLSSSDTAEQLNIIRIVIDKMMNIERAFIYPRGLPGRPYYKHVVFAPSSINAYGSTLFPGVADALYEAVHFGGSWTEVRKQIDIARTHVRQATYIVREPSLLYAPKC